MPEYISALDAVIQAFQNDVLNNERKAASELIRAYAGSWKVIRRELSRLESEIPRVEAGQLSEMNWFYQNRRLLDLKPLIESELKKLGEFATDRVSQEQLRAIESASEYQRDLMVLGMGGLYDIPEALRIRTLPTEQIAAMVGMNQVGSPLRSLFDGLTIGGGEIASDILSEAVTMGYNPRKVAPKLMDAFGMMLNRALTISRTEVMRAGHVATQKNYEANADVVKSWRWHAHPDGLTCPTCMVMHGTIHPVTERLASHPNCRCVEIPETISWEELGAMYGLDLSGITPGSAEFDAVAKKYNLSEKQIQQHNFSKMKGTDYIGNMSPDKQIGLLGPGKWVAWRNGDITLEQMVQETWSPVWGKGLAAVALRGVIGSDTVKSYVQLGREYVRIVSASPTATAEARAEAVRLLERYAKAEPGVTNLLKSLVEGAGGRMEGLKHRLKGEDSLARKITSIGIEEGITPRNAAGTMRDVIRYTGIFKGEELVQKAKGISDSLKGEGWQVLKVRNYFGGGGNYEGLHFVFGNGKIQMEMQFHTEESFRIKMANHYDYEVYRTTGASKVIKTWTDSLMMDNWAGFTPPDGYGNVNNFGD